MFAVFTSVSCRVVAVLAVFNPVPCTVMAVLAVVG